MTENEKIELFDKWYYENYDELAEGEEGIALREELEQAFKSGIEALEKENAELKAKLKEHESIGNAQFWENVWSWKSKSEQLTKAKELLKRFIALENCTLDYDDIKEAEQFLNSEVEK